MQPLSPYERLVLQEIVRRGLDKSECLWPEEFSVLDPEVLYKFVQICRTWDEAGQMVHTFPDKQYLKELAAEWVKCRKTGSPFFVEKSRRLVTSWVLRGFELFDLGLSRGNWLLTHTKRADAAAHVWRVWFMYSDLQKRFPEWKLPDALTYGNELTQMLDMLVLPNQSKYSQYYEQPKGLQGSGFSGVTMEEISIYRQPAGMWDQAIRLVQAAPGMRRGLVCAVTNYEFNDSYESIIKGASESPY